ncbi:uncharacterized protein LOC122508939, partial [Leptopilina heterotoma]|uniref:uncharacterized protein LOC122508939 n=1 Tax=Leptopilina heterotoma TaxID=63436 RepID=UPI001CA93E23
QSPSAGEIAILPCDGGDPSPISNDEVIFFPDKQEKPKREKRETVKAVKKDFRFRHQKESELKDLKATFNAKSDCLDTKWEKLNSDDIRKNDNKAPLKTISHRKLNRRKKQQRENTKFPAQNSTERNKEKSANSSSSEASNDVLEEAASKEGIMRYVANEFDLQTNNCNNLSKSRKYLWFSKNTKDHILKSQEEEKSKSVKSLKVKKTCSPHKKLSRSSLTIESDKITINLSKYSPCASRLAASSKILSNESVSNSESPLHLPHSRSPSHVNVQPNSLPMDKMSIQASLSLNIHQFEKTRSNSRSRSVGDSCVTSPTSEGTTLSYSPTVTEILSLEEVIPQIFVTEESSSYLDIKRKSDNSLSEKARKATLETKC